MISHHARQQTGQHAPRHGARQHESSTWESAPLDLEAYLQRIGYQGALSPSLSTLRALQQAHLQAIPFENLEIVTGGEIRLDLASLQDKLVSRHRGGYCHEQNIFFATVLDRLGFQVAGRSARMLMGESEQKVTGLGHTILNVSVEGKQWLVDVGVGNIGPRQPIPLEEDVDVSHGGWRYRLELTSAGRWLLRHWRDDGWFNLYQFNDEPYFRADYEDHNFVVSTHPDSPFTRRIVAQLNGEAVRYALTDRELKVFRPEAPAEQREIAAADLPALLRELFGLTLDTQQTQRLLRRAEGIRGESSEGEPLGT
ncbi:arylamine N-acetyltransferase family protein [Billgrantia endophytica]|uniref:Acetyltransferase n=1 Tax=Billgrantia endophytica TaxID=2033802 RepID=A0A2N7U7Q2_9GAMM|nr:arylamine N-acetyltransferase [Halomonas endophytica]PMR76446.1 acetyltransferase [Halomonas endophytica]